MLTITITGETPEDVKNQLQAFDKALTPGAKSGKGASNDDTGDKSEKQAAKDKKVADKEPEDKPLTHEDARAAIISLSKKLDWDPAPPKINAFTKKFAKKHDITDDAGDLIERIPQIPVKKLKAFIEAVKEAEAEGEI